MHIDARVFLPVAALPQCELSVKVAQLLGLRGPWRRQVCRDMDCLRCRSYGPIRVFFQASCRSLKIVIAAMKLKDAYSLEGKL